MCLFIDSFHPYMGLLAAAAFLCMGVAVPLIISKVSGNTGDEIRGQSGELAALVLENIRGLNETIQYGKGNERMELMNSRTDALSQKQSALNKLTGTNIAIANTFNASALILSLSLYSSGAVDICGMLIPLLAFMSHPIMAIKHFILSKKSK